MLGLLQVRSHGSRDDCQNRRGAQGQQAEGLVRSFAILRRGRDEAFQRNRLQIRGGTARPKSCASLESSRMTLATR